MMPYWLRVVLGVVLGAAAGVASWYFLGIAWLTATLAALFAAVGFLGSYFLWSADRPEEGYEQVLFDRPNTIVTLALVVVFAGAGIGSGFLGGAAAPASGVGDDMAALYASYLATSAAFSKEEADGPTTVAKITELRAENARLKGAVDALPAGTERDGLTDANTALGAALQALEACASGTKAECVNARLAAADAQTALHKAGALEEEAA